MSEEIPIYISIDLRQLAHKTMSLLSINNCIPLSKCHLILAIRFDLLTMFLDDMHKISPTMEKLNGEEE